VISYSYPGEQGEVEVHCSLDRGQSPPRVCLLIRDWGQAFDPTSTDKPDLTPDPDRRRAGGLGIFLISQMADDVSYSRAEGANNFQLCFRL
jgi:anti-sigma regulatory factor (Ser/Thr protein kinase)